jgi:hypothetical protein
MPVRTVMLVATFLCMFCGPAHADFKYTQSGQFTNGVAQVKAVFRTQATEVTVYVQDAFLRIDLPTVGMESSIWRVVGRFKLSPRTEPTASQPLTKSAHVRRRQKEQFPSHPVITQDLNLRLTSTGKMRTLLDQTAQNTRVEISYNSMESLVVDS